MTDRLAQFRELREWTKLAEQQTGKGILTQLSEIRTLRNFGGQCSVSDYYWHKQYDDDYLKGRGRRDFLGWRLLQEFSLALNPRFAVLPAWDKLVFTQLAEAAGLPVAPVVATYHHARKLAPSLGLHLKSQDEACAFLRNAASYPLFGKPGFSQSGHGAAFLMSFDSATDRLTLLDGTTVSVSEFTNRLESTVDFRYHKPQCGYLFQAPLQPAQEITSITECTAICGVRIVCLNGPDGVQPIRAMWKIALPPNHTDNFGMGDHGNLLADVDLFTGEVRTVIGGFWPKTTLFKCHPISGASFEGFHLPGWAQVLDICKAGGAAFPLMKIHHWDFALTDMGPVILELNDLGGTQIAQMHGHGLLTEETRGFLKRHANPQAHPWVKAL